MFIFLPFFFHLFCVPILGAAYVDIQASPNIIGSSNIQFTFTLNNAVITNTSYIQITYPNEFVLTSFFCPMSFPSSCHAEPNNAVLANVGGFTDLSSISFRFGYFSHVGTSNSTHNFQILIYGGIDPYTLTTQVKLVPHAISCNFSILFLTHFI